MMKTITMISTLPPIEKGMSKYTTGLVKALSEVCEINFLGFNRIYPSFLYHGKIYSDKGWDFEHPNLKVRNVLNWYNPFGWIIEAFRVKTEIVHVQHWTFFLSPTYWFLLSVLRLRGKRIIMTVHNVELHGEGVLKSWIYRSAFPFATEFLVHTQQNKKQLSKYVRNKKITVLPHGLIEPPQTKIKQSECRKKLGLKSDEKVLLCFGNIREYKGVDDAIKALNLLKDEKIKLVIAGECWENWNKYERLINDLNVSSRVITKIKFIPDEEIEIFFKSADLVLLPYKYFEAQSGVGTLGLSFEKPMIVSKTGGLPELVSDERAIVPSGDPKQLAKAIDNIFSDKELYSKLVSDSKKLKTELSWNNIVKDYMRRLY